MFTTWVVEPLPNARIPTVVSNFPEEYDDTIRKTDIYFLSETLGGLKQLQALNDFTSLKHWAVGCDFGNRLIIYEWSGKGGQVSWSHWNAQVSGNVFSHVIKLGTVYTSPQHVRNLAARNPRSKKRYNLLTNNCQFWVEWLLKQISHRLFWALQESQIKKINDTPFGRQSRTWFYKWLLNHQ